MSKDFNYLVAVLTFEHLMLPSVGEGLLVLAVGITITENGLVVYHFKQSACLLTSQKFCTDFNQFCTELCALTHNDKKTPAEAGVFVFAGEPGRGTATSRQKLFPRLPQG